MKNTNHIERRQIWFARWTKTSWAVFNSLNRVVHIQYMTITAFKNTLLQEASIFTDDYMICSDIEQTEEEKELEPNLLDTLLLTLLTISTQNRVIDTISTFEVVSPIYIIPTDLVCKAESVGLFLYKYER